MVNEVSKVSPLKRPLQVNCHPESRLGLCGSRSRLGLGGLRSSRSRPGLAEEQQPIDETAGLAGIHCSLPGTKCFADIIVLALLLLSDKIWSCLALEAGSLNIAGNNIGNNIDINICLNLGGLNLNLGGLNIIGDINIGGLNIIDDINTGGLLVDDINIDDINIVDCLSLPPDLT